MDPTLTLPAILAVCLVAVASPGPATLAISATAARDGAGAGLRMAAGVACGSLFWNVAAALGLAGVMAAHAGLVQALRLLGGAYLLWLAWGAARRAWQPRRHTARAAPRPFRQGLLLHLTNPKAIFFFGALYSAMLAAGVTFAPIAAAVALQSSLVFVAYALLFSRPAVQRAHARAARWSDGLAAVLFAGFGLRLLSKTAP